MPIAQPTGPGLCASVDLTTRETRSFSATSTPASKAPVESTLIARLMDSVLSVGAEPTTLGTPSLDAALSHAQQVPVEQTLTARLRGKQPSANVRPTMWVIRTPTVGSIPARALLADRGRSARTMVEQQTGTTNLRQLYRCSYQTQKISAYNNTKPQTKTNRTYKTKLIPLPQLLMHT